MWFWHIVKWRPFLSATNSKRKKTLWRFHFQGHYFFHFNSLITTFEHMERLKSLVPSQLPEVWCEKGLNFHVQSYAVLCPIFVKYYKPWFCHDYDFFSGFDSRRSVKPLLFRVLRENSGSTFVSIIPGNILLHFRFSKKI